MQDQEVIHVEVSVTLPESGRSPRSMLRNQVANPDDVARWWENWSSSFPEMTLDGAWTDGLLEPAERGEHALSPRLVYLLDSGAMLAVDNLFEALRWTTTIEEFALHAQLPGCVEAYLAGVGESWRRAWLDEYLCCFERMLFSIRAGRVPEALCVGDRVALSKIVDEAESWMGTLSEGHAEEFAVELSALPDSGAVDTDFTSIRTQVDEEELTRLYHYNAESYNSQAGMFQRHGLTTPLLWFANYEGLFA